MAIELRPPIDVDKGVPVRGLVDGFDTAAFAGDDYGDLPAFAALGDAVAGGASAARGADRRARRAKRRPSSPAPVDLVVDGPTGLLGAARPASPTPSAERVADALG